MLTDERISEIFDEELERGLDGRLNRFARAIEDEVMAEVCSAQNSEYAPQDCLSLTDATQVRMEAQEPVGCVLYYEIAPYRGVCGATVGADGGGEFADVFLGDPEACATVAREKVLEMERRGTKLKNASILCNGDIYSYSGSHVTVTSLAPQPPATCPKCAESKQEAFEEGRRTDNMRQELKERGRKIDALQAKVVELESLRAQDAKAYERLDELRNRDADKIADQAALIEKCEELLRDYTAQEKRDQWCGPATELLAAIAAQKGGAA